MGERLEPSGIATRPQKVKVLGAKTGQFEQLREDVGNSIGPGAIGVMVDLCDSGSSCFRLPGEPVEISVVLCDGNRDRGFPAARPNIMGQILWIPRE